VKLLSYRAGTEERFGAVKGEGVVDLGRALGGRYGALSEVLTPERLDEVRAAVERGSPDVALAGLDYAPVITNPSRIICVGVNYSDHAAEAAREIAPFPSIFLRLVESVVGHGKPILRPRVSTDLDYEGELAVVIGRPGQYIPRERALEHVAGYSCFNDASVRDWQRHNPGPTPGKNFYGCGSFGPWLVTADEVGNPTQLTLSTRLNGVEVQHVTTNLMINDIPTVIEYVSAWTPLRTGDVISTGTPAGVGMGRKPPLWMKPGDVVEVTISGIGTLSNPIEYDTGTSE
jgi:2-keto-4-pentenoate hydratase/2-oxohepta-3-ene-1,7-dioic acid hydratase in catechol pathway